MRAIGVIFLSVLVLALAGVGAAIAATHSGTRTATVATARSGLGRIVVDGRGRTLYLFEKDRHGRSACSGTCAAYWPPLLTSAKPVAKTGVKASLIGTTKRADGTKQVTLAGHPLYFFSGDVKHGDTSGEGLHDFGAGWYVLAPSGKKIDRD